MKIGWNSREGLWIDGNQKQKKLPSGILFRYVLARINLLYIAFFLKELKEDRLRNSKVYDSKKNINDVLVL